MKYLIVVDMQNDFIDGSLGSNAAQDIVPNVIEKIKSFNGAIIFTKDTHKDNYLQTQEGKKLPIEHCILGTDGYQIKQTFFDAAKGKQTHIASKQTFGYCNWQSIFGQNHDNMRELESIELIGVCTDICVISNALILKALYPEVPIAVDKSCCAGTCLENHEAALKVMQSCQIEIV